MKLYLCAILPLLVCGCATTKSTDAYPPNWVQSSTLVPSTGNEATAVSAIAAAAELTPIPGRNMYAYSPPRQCYVIIEDKSVVSEICQRDEMIVYNPAATGTMSSIIPAEIAGVLVIQGHLEAPVVEVPALESIAEPI